MTSAAIERVAKAAFARRAQGTNPKHTTVLDKSCGRVGVCRVSADWDGRHRLSTQLSAVQSNDQKAAETPLLKPQEDAFRPATTGRRRCAHRKPMQAKFKQLRKIHP